MHLDSFNRQYVFFVQVDFDKTFEIQHMSPKKLKSATTTVNSLIPLSKRDYEKIIK